MMPSLRYRLVLIVGTSVCLLLTVFGFFVSTIFELSLIAELDSSLTERARSLSHLVEHEEHVFTFEWLEGAEASAPIDQQRESFAIWNEGDLLEVFPPQTSPIEPPQKPVEQAFDCILANKRARAIAFPFAPRVMYESDMEASRTTRPVLTLVFARTTNEVDSAIIKLRWTVLFVGMSGLVVTIAVLWFVIGIGLRPVQHATEQIANIVPGTLSERIEQVDRQPSELRPLLSTINDLLERLEKAFVRERSFSSDVAHELRTPLAGLRAQLDLSLSRERSTKDYQKTIGQCLKITEQTSEIVESLLETTRDSVAASPPELVDLQRLLDDLFIERRQVMQSRKLQFQPSHDRSFTISIERQPLVLILRNLVDNAVYYADTGSTIEVFVERSGCSCFIVVSNQATSFPTTDIDKVFNRFWRADTSRHETGRHCGLGLALCRRLAERMGGSIQASIVEQSFRIELALPFCSESA
jgi:two-component system, OmpR family, heavy metal sensor histidine kinase CusS